MPNYVPGYGPHDAKLMFVGEAPGADEDRLEKPFVGAAGQFLTAMCEEIGLDRRQVYVTNVLKYRPPFNKLDRFEETGHTYEECITQLWQEIGEINPNCIVAFGNYPLKILTGKGTGSKGITQWRGSIVRTQHLDYKVVPTFHPSALLRSSDEVAEGEKKKGALGYGYRHISKLDLLRAIEESQTRELRLPERSLEIIKDSVNLQRFFERYRDCKRVAIDIEVMKAVPVCIGFAFNGWHGVSVPLLNPPVKDWEGLADHELALIWRIIGEFLAREDIEIVGQNFKFDHLALRNICGFHIPKIYGDTSLLAHTLHSEFPKKLEFNQSIYTRHPYYKDEGKEFNPKRDKFDRFLLYNAQDCIVEFDLFEAMYDQAGQLEVPGFPEWRKTFFEDYVMKLHDLYMEMDGEGMLVDGEKQKGLIKEYEEKARVAQLELDEVAGFHVNCNSPKQVAVLLFNQFRLPRRKGVDEDTLIALEANVAKRPEHKRAIELILLLRRLRKSVGTYFRAKPDYDGRMRTSYQICGTETGRSSTKLLKPPVRPEKIGLAFQTMTKHGDVGSELRAMFIADEGYSWVEVDLSQAEARIVAILGRDEKTLELFRSGADIHSLTATWCFGVPLTGVTPELRFIGKTTRHAGNYDMQKHMLMQLVNTGAKRFHINISISEWKAGKILDAFHAYSPNIRGVFHQEVRDALEQNNRVLVNPFGRYRQFYDRWGRDLWKEAYAQIPQSTVPDHLRKAWINLRRICRAEQIEAHFTIEAHDAIIARVPDRQIARYVQIIQAELNRPIDFTNCTLSRGELIIPSEVKVGKNYKDCKDKSCKGCDYMHDYHLPKDQAA